MDASVEYDNKIGQSSDRGVLSRMRSYVRVWSILSWQGREGKTRGTSQLRPEKKEKAVRETLRTDGPPRLLAIMSRSRKLAAPSSIMPSSYIVMCDQTDLLSSFLLPLFVLTVLLLLLLLVQNAPVASSRVFSILFHQRRLSRAQSFLCKLAGENKPRGTLEADVNVPIRGGQGLKIRN